MGLPEQPMVPGEYAQKAAQTLFCDPPEDGDEILYIGNTESLIKAVNQYCNDQQVPKPAGLAIELYDEYLPELRSEYTGEIQFLGVDFLTADLGEFEYILAYPPVVQAKELRGTDLNIDRDAFRGARRNFDLSSLYLEHALDHLPGRDTAPTLQSFTSNTSESGRLSMFLPQGFTTAESARALRKWVIANFHVERLDTFTIQSGFKLLLTTIENQTIETQSGRKTHTPAGEFTLPAQGEPWSRAIQGAEQPVNSDTELQDICRRVGAGVATGADEVFVRDEDDPVLQEVDPQWHYPVIGGKQLAAYDDVESNIRIICPYSEKGLASERELDKSFLQWAEMNRDKLEDRASVSSQRGNRPWYAWAQKPNLENLLRPKILTRDFADEVRFWTDQAGTYIPRRTVYSIIPKGHVEIESLYDYLTRSDVRRWIEASSEKNRGYRIRTRTLRELPVPSEFNNSKK